MTTNTLLLHGGGGPATVLGLQAHLATLGSVATPTHPGWSGTERPAGLDSVAALADHYSAMIEQQDLRDVTVVGSSVGGWLAAELALRDTAGRIVSLVLVNCVGVEIAGEPITNVSGLAPAELAALSFHDASALPVREAPTPEMLVVLAGNAAALAAYAGDPYMHDPTLLGRLGGISVPTLVIWGESDRVVSLQYGRAFAAAIPGSRFVPVKNAGHLPWIEQPDAVFAAIDESLRAS